MSGYEVDNPPLTASENLPDIVEGDDITFDINFTDENDDAINITGWEVWMTVKEEYKDDDSSAVIQVSTTTHDNPTGGVTSLKFTSSDTDGVTGSKVWDLQFKKSNGDIRTAISGTVIFKQQVTEAS